ncbi:MAG: alpha/beta hydrolase [Desulfobacterales bacterium]
MTPTTDLTEKRLTVRIRGHDLFVRTLSHAGPRSPGSPTLVFLHEGLGCTRFWRDIPERLAMATALDALIYDRKGYGRSDPASDPRQIDYLHREAREDLPDLLASFSVDRALHVGHSDGGSIALIHAAAFPKHVAAVVTLAAHVFVEEETLAGIRTTVDRYREGRLYDRLAAYHGQKTRRMFDDWAVTWLSHEFADWNIESMLGNIRCPVLVIQGEKDPYGTQAQVRAILQGIGSNARQRMIPDSGHAPHIDRPEQTLTDILSFITETAMA